MRVSVVLLNWNGFEDTVECIRTLMTQERHEPYDVVVVDNSSSDGSVDRLEQSLGHDHLVRTSYDAPNDSFDVYPADDSGSRVVLVSSNENLGFCRGNNVGAHLAFDLGADVVVILNNDTTVATNFIEEMSAAGDVLGDRVLVSPQILYADEPESVWWHGGSFSSLLGPRYGHQGEAVRRGTTSYTSTEWVSGCGTMISRRLFDEIGLYDEKFFIWCEEWDLSLRARQRGVQMRVASEALVWHKVGRSLGIVSPLTFFYSQRNMRFLRKRYLSRAAHWAYGALITPRKAFQAVTFALRFKDLRFVLAFVDATVDNEGGIWKRQR